MIVKICGITRSVDAAVVAAAGADAVGFVLAPSPRRIDVAVAGAIDRSITGGCRRVGVFVDAPLDDVRRAIRIAGLDVVQLHGGETPEHCRRVAALGVEVWKRIDVRRDDTPARIAARAAAFSGFGVGALLADPGSGDGRTFDWSLLRRLAGVVIVAGGLTADNVAAAIHTVRPGGVDVSSGVEAAPGIKDESKIEAFVQRARRSFAGAAEGEEDSRHAT